MRWNHDRVRALLLGRRAVRVVQLPGSLSPDGEGEPIFVGVRVLTETEIDQCRLDAIQYAETRAKKLGISSVEMLSIDGELVDREVKRAIVFRAFVEVDGENAEPEEAPPADQKAKPKEPTPFFPALQAVRQIDSVMLQVLWETYVDHQEYTNPRRPMTDEQVKELADALSKGPAATASLAQCERVSLVRLLLSLVSRLSTSPSGS